MSKLSLVRAIATLTVEERGRLMTAAEIAAQVFGGNVSKKWVFANVPVHYRHKVGRTVLYYEGEIRWWIEQLKQVA